ncbi:MAG: hypothetical protein IJ088_01490 [Clostridia bacterium]|nr:hypothetical protein [Clostridia bacterium]
MFEYFTVSLTKDAKGKSNGIGFSRCEEKIMRARCGYSGSLLFKADIDLWQAQDICEFGDEYGSIIDQVRGVMGSDGSRNTEEGYAFLSFVGLIPLSGLRHVRKNRLIDAYESSYGILDEMEPIRYCELSDGTAFMTMFTSSQHGICTACEIMPPKECLPAFFRE